MRFSFYPPLATRSDTLNASLDRVKKLKIPVLRLPWPLRIRFATLLLLSAAFFYGAYEASHKRLSLLPVEGGGMPWKISSNSDRQIGGASDVTVHEHSDRIDFDFHIATQPGITYIAVAALFGDINDMTEMADWSDYQSLSIDVRCDPENVFMLVLHTFDEKVTRAGDYLSLRRSTAYFSCGIATQRVHIDLTQLQVPEWWLLQQGVEVTDREYDLGKVFSFSLINSTQSPQQVKSNMVVSGIQLHGRNWTVVYIAAGCFATMWAIFFTLGLRSKSQNKTQVLQHKYPQERLLVACPKIPDRLSDDVDRDAVLRYMATKYIDPELSIEMAGADLQISRTKINAILKDELGLTFTGYINKLRLTEAARLLRQKEASVAEIAYQVGFSSPSYFATVFKKEYGTTPGDFRRQVADEHA